jgi:hypothetical protein
LTRSQLIDEYFIENRTKLLDIAAYLDRLDRAPAAGIDFRMEAFARALDALRDGGTERIERVQLIFSDPTPEPRERLDQKSAVGAYDDRGEVR